MTSTMISKPVVVRQVWASNLESEFAIIRRILPCYRHIAIDTEFPGFIYSSKDKCHYSKIPPPQNYAIMKANVDALNIIQMGLALSDFVGNLPDLGTESCYVWEFNFMDFDIEHDPSDPKAIRLLQQQGIDFAKNVAEGISSKQFRRLFFDSGLLFSSFNVWVTFHGYYDFGYLMKILIAKDLPPNIASFHLLMSCFFGQNVYDMKHMMNYCNGLYGGLEKLANILNVYRVAGKSHTAGSDSLLTLQTFVKLRDVYFTKHLDSNKECLDITKFKGIIYGLGTIARQCPMIYRTVHVPVMYSPMGLPLLMM